MSSKLRLSRRRSEALFLALEKLEARLQFDAVYHAIGTGPLIQDWSNTGLIINNDDWSGVPSIEGYRGDGLASGTGTDPQTVVGTSTVLDVNANHADPDTFTTGGVTEFDFNAGTTGNPTIAIKSTGTAKAPYVEFYLDTTGQSQLQVKYTLRDVGGSHNAATPAALQYRVGETGNWINVPAGYISNILTSDGTVIDATMPADTLNQPKVQVRVITADAVGSDEWIGVDDIIISNGNIVQPTVQFGLDNYFTYEPNGAKTITVTRSGDLSLASDVNYATVAGGSATAGSDYTSVSGMLHFDVNQGSATFDVPITNDTDQEGNETINLQLSSPSGATLGTPATSIITIADDDTPAPNGVLLNELNVNPGGSDTGKEWLEIKGAPGQTLTNVFVASLEGDQGAGVGSADYVYDLTGLTLGSNGLLLIKSPNNTSISAAPGTTVVDDPALNASPLENGTVSHLLIYSPTPISTGVDFDPSDNGSLVLPQGATLLDGVGWNDGSAAGDHSYGAQLSLPSGIPDAATRILGNTAQTDASAWYFGPLLDTGNPDEVIYDVANGSSNIPNSAVLTPGAPNYTSSNVNGEIGFSRFTTTVGEDAGTFDLTVNRATGSTGAVSVDYSITAGTATAGSDYNVASGTLSFADGQTSATIPVDIIDDSITEPLEDFTVTLSNATGGATIGPRASTDVSIVDNDSKLLLNEILVNVPREANNTGGVDSKNEYVEFRGTPGQVLQDVYFVSVEGDGQSAAGNVTYVANLTGVAVGADGLIMIKSPSNVLLAGASPNTTVIDDVAFDNSNGILQNGSNSFLVIISPTAITTSSDLDTNGDGTLDLPNGSTVLDGIGWIDNAPGTGGDFTYGTTLPAIGIVAPEAATRLLGNDTPNSLSAWYYGSLIGTQGDTATAAAGDDKLVYTSDDKAGHIVSGNLEHITGMHLTPGEENFPAAPHLDVPGTFTQDAPAGQTAQIQLDYSADVSGSLNTSNASIVLTNRSTSQVIPSGNLAFTAGAGYLQTITFPGYTNSTLPDGYYRLTINHAGVSDDFGLAATDDVQVDFFSLAADANHDAAVNAIDFNALATHYGQAATYSGGDFNYDGTVNSDDFSFLAQKFNNRLIPVPGAPLGSLVGSSSATSSAQAAASLFSDKQIAGDLPGEVIA